MRGSRERKLRSWRRCVEVGIVVAEGGPGSKSGTPRNESVRQGGLRVPMWKLLADCSGIKRRSGIIIAWIVRGIGRSRRTRVMTCVRRSRMRIWLRPWLGHRGSMDHRAIHESKYGEKKKTSSWFYSNGGSPDRSMGRNLT